jgi:F5/8 type C domain
MLRSRTFWLALLGLFALPAANVARTPNAGGHVTVDTTYAHALNAFSPVRALGAGVDAQNNGAVKQIYVQSTIAQLLSAGLGTVTYRLYTELGVQDWHWNPQGSWSDPAGQGYWTGAAAASSPAVEDSYGYRLPHRGFTHDQANDDDYSRLDDGDPTTYWKSDPYLDQYYTGESDTLHEQWILIDLGAKKAVDAISLAWANPYASAYAVQYWSGDDAIYDPAHGAWTTFPNGAVTSGSGGTAVLQLANSTLRVRYVRVLMQTSSNTCDTHGNSDVRDCLGFALDEVGLGTLAGSQFHDLIVHQPNAGQTVTYASSVDPWHAPLNEVKDEEQAGLDIVYTSGITRGLPAVIPVAMVYGTPDDAAAEIRYVEARGYAIGYVELGEEPDGQYILPEDYGALYVQWAKALHAVDPALKLGGPVFQGANSDVQTWPDAKGNVSWLNRFLAYLSSHGGLGQLGFMSFEHYPFGSCGTDTEKNLLQEPGLVAGIVKTWFQDGLPPGTPLLITETNYSANTSEHFQDITGALWFADFAGSFLSAGGTGLNLYEYEPDPLFNYAHCAQGWGSWGMWNADNRYRIKQPTSQYFAAQLLTQAWGQPVDANQMLFSASSDILDSRKRQIVTAYALHRPDGAWALLLINKDPQNAYTVQVTFQGTSGTQHFSSPVASYLLSPAQYVWHPDGKQSHAAPDGPFLTGSQSGGPSATYTLPASSLTVLRATLGTH